MWRLLGNWLLVHRAEPFHRDLAWASSLIHKSSTFMTNCLLMALLLDAVTLCGEKVHIQTSAAWFLANSFMQSLSSHTYRRSKELRW